MKRLREKKALTRAAVLSWLERRHWLRVHMFFIVAATFLAGLLATNLLMRSGVDVLWQRYAIAVCAAYLTFLGLIRIWIWYVCSGGDSEADALEGVDLFVRQLDKVDGASTVVSSAGGGSNHSGCLSFDVSGDDGCAVVILLALLVGVLLIAGGYLIYAAPAILGEAVFEALLAAALARRAKKLEAGGWAGSVFRATVWIFFAVFTMSIVLGWYAQEKCPGARRIRDAINCAAAAREPHLR